MNSAGSRPAQWAVSGFTEVLAQEVVPLGIRVTAIGPGAMPTGWAGSSIYVPAASDADVPAAGWSGLLDSRGQPLQKLYCPCELLALGRVELGVDGPGQLVGSPAPVLIQ